jgi:translation initiation factor IF-3
MIDIHEFDPKTGTAISLVESRAKGQIQMFFAGREETHDVFIGEALFLKAVKKYVKAIEARPKEKPSPEAARDRKALAAESRMDDL